MTEAAAWRVISRAIFLVFGLLVGALLLFNLQQLIIQLMVAGLIAAALNPLVEGLSGSQRARKMRWRPGRGVAAVVVLLAGFLFFYLVGFIISRSVGPDLATLRERLPIYAVQVEQAFEELLASNPDLAGRLTGGEIPLPSIQQILSSSAGVLSQATRVVSVASSVVSGVLFVVFTLILSLYLVMDADRIRRFVVALMPFAWQPPMLRASERIGERLGAWSRGQVLLGGIIGFMTYVAALLIGLPYAAALALIAGIGELVPNLGPIMAAIPFIIVGFLSSPQQGVFAIFASIAIQQLENNLIVPRVMGRVVELHPVAVMVAILAGNQLLGILGALLAVPVAASLAVILDELQQARQVKHVADVEARGLTIVS